MKKHIAVFVFCVTLLLSQLLSGCTNKQEPSLPDKTDETINFLLQQAQGVHKDITAITLQYSQILDFGIYYQFSCNTDSDTQYEAMMIVDDKLVHAIDIAQIDKDSPVTRHVMSGTIQHKDKTQTLYMAVSGIVNDSKVAKVRLFLSGDALHEVQIGETKAYNVVVVGTQPNTQKIEALDKKDTVLFSLD